MTNFWRRSARISFASRPSTAREVRVFGSVARGEADRESDIDDFRIQETLSVEEAYRPAIRDQGFRRAVVKAYAHRCALCGIRVRTLDGHTAVAAAHIVPWSETRDDRPANGIALCRMCHWTFDEGLLGISQEYQVITSQQLIVLNNLPGYLTNLEGRGIVGPSRKLFWPDAESPRWHHENVLRT